jgi:hypothetical protein
MVAAVFLMQPLRQLAAPAMSLLTLVTIGKSRGLATEKYYTVAFLVVDNMWRLVIVVARSPILSRSFSDSQFLSPLDIVLKLTMTTQHTRSHVE